MKSGAERNGALLHGGRMIRRKAITASGPFVVQEYEAKLRDLPLKYARSWAIRWALSFDQDQGVGKDDTQTDRPSGTGGVLEGRFVNLSFPTLPELLFAGEYG